MKQPFDKYSRKSYRRAFTLVEVVASLALAGTLLVAILVAHQRHVAQVRRATVRMRAIEAADKLLSSWRSDETGGPTKASGNLPGAPEFSWRWTIRECRELSSVGAAIGRLEIWNAVLDDKRPAVSVEVLTTAVAQAEKRLY
jgi:prepilin-type N-terminal cleavage/methylation domain-containing protein